MQRQRVLLRFSEGALSANRTPPKTSFFFAIYILGIYPRLRRHLGQLLGRVLLRKNTNLRISSSKTSFRLIFSSSIIFDYSCLSPLGWLSVEEIGGCETKGLAKIPRRCSFGNIEYHRRPLFFCTYTLGSVGCGICNAASSAAPRYRVPPKTSFFVPIPI